MNVREKDTPVAHAITGNAIESVNTQSGSNELLPTDAVKALLGGDDVGEGMCSWDIPPPLDLLFRRSRQDQGRNRPGRSDSNQAHNSSAPATVPAKSLPKQGTLASLWQRFTLALMEGAGKPVRALNSSAALRFGTMLGRFAHAVAGKQRRRAVANLHLAYGDTMAPGERAALARRVFEHYGRCVVEFLRSPSVTRDDLDARVTCEGYEHIERAQALGKGVIFVSGHFGNWEILGRWGAQVRGLPLTVVAKDPKQPSLAAYLRRMREGSGFGVLSMGESARSLLRVLKRGEIICLLADQNSGDLFAPFFGVPAGTPSGPAALALHSGAVLLPIHCIATDGPNFHIRCQPPVPAESTGDREADTLRLTIALNAALESAVREHPDQWLWLHNRWKAAFDAGNRQRAWGVSGDPASDAAFGEAYERWRA